MLAAWLLTAGLIASGFFSGCKQGRPGYCEDAAVSTNDDSGTNGTQPHEDGYVYKYDACGWYVTFLSPPEGAVVSNPVLFEIQASFGIDEVEIFADETYSLGPPWDPNERGTLLYRFAGTGYPRNVHVTGRLNGSDVVRDDITFTVAPDDCEDRFFVSEFNNRNTDPSGNLDLVGIREEALATIRTAVSELQGCGAQITPGAMMSLLLYEGGFRAGAYNTRCTENSYNNTPSDCDLVAEALYSYQFGIGAIHTSNFHPCKGGSYTQSMREKLTELMEAAGFDTDPSIVTPELATRFSTVCPGENPIAVDYYILGAHEHFSIPKNNAGNYLEGYGAFPFFDAHISVNMTFNILFLSCSSIGSDRDAIAIWGGGDASYSNPAKQDQILSYYQNFAAANCE